MRRAVFAFAASILASVASADPLTINADGFPEGTDITSAFPVVTLRHLTIVNGPNGAELLVGNIYAKECLTPSDPTSECSAIGSGHFGHQSGPGVIGGSFNAESTSSINCVTSNPNSCRFSPHDFLDVTFDFAVQTVSIDATHRSDWPWAWGFDAAGNLLQVEIQRTWHKEYGPAHPNNAFGYQTLTVTAVSGQLSRVVFAGVGGFVRLDRLTYTMQ